MMRGAGAPKSRGVAKSRGAPHLPSKTSRDYNLSKTCSPSANSVLMPICVASLSSIPNIHVSRNATTRKVNSYVRDDQGLRGLRK